MCIKFRDDRLRGFWSAGCQSLPFPIDTDGRPYNSATLPREDRVHCDVINDLHVIHLMDLMDE